MKKTNATSYKIETNKKEIELAIAALKIYKSELFDLMQIALKHKLNERYNYLNKRSLETKALINKLMEINDPPF